MVSRGPSGGPALGFNLVLMSNFNPPKRVQLQSIDQFFTVCQASKILLWLSLQKEYLEEVYVDGQAALDSNDKKLILNIYNIRDGAL